MTAPNLATAEVPLTSVPQDTEKYFLGKQTEILEGTSPLLEIEDISSPPLSNQFQRSNSESINFGITESTNWFRFALTSPADDSHPPQGSCDGKSCKYLLFIGKHLDFYDRIEVFTRLSRPEAPDAHPDWQQISYGMEHAIAKGARDPLYITVSLPQDRGSVVEYYVRASNLGGFYLKPILYSPQAYIEFSNKLNIFYGVYYGLVLSMLVYNLFHYFFLRDNVRLLFICYAVTIALYFFVVNELMGSHIPVYLLEYTRRTAQLLILLSFLLCMYISMLFLDAKHTMPFVYKALLAGASATVLMIAALPFFSYFAIGRFLPIFGLLIILLAICSGIIALVKGYRPAKFFLCAWFFFFSGGMVYSLNFMGLFPYAFIGNNAAQIGSGLDMVFLSLAIADRVKYLFEQLHQAQQRREAQLKKLNQQLIQTEERERRRIAARLHDSIGQALCATKLEIQNTLLGSGDNYPGHNKAVSYLDFCIKETRTLTAELYPQELYKLGLNAALFALTQKYNQRFSLVSQFKGCDDNDLRLSEELTFMLYRIAGELLNNVVKHAQASTAMLMLFQENCEVVLAVEDDGKGFDRDEIFNREERGFGLFHIRERLQHVNGSMVVEPKQSFGTKIAIRIPIEGDDT